MNDTTRIPLSRPRATWVLFVFAAVPLMFVLRLTVKYWIVNGEFLWWTAAITLAPCFWIAYRYWHRSGGWADWDPVSFLEVGDGKVTVFPPRTADYLFKRSEAVFRPGSRLEYHIESGDMLFNRDHGQVLRLSLWVAQPDGAKKVLISEYARINAKFALERLRKEGIPLRIIKVYDSQDGEHTEIDVTEEYSRRGNISLLAVLLGSSSLWLGALAGALVHQVDYVVMIGILGFVVFSIISIFYSSAKPTARIVRAATILPSYAAGYAVAAVVARYFAVG